MIVVDTSALAAILFAEPERDSFATIIAESGHAYVPAPNVLELLIVASGRYGDSGRAKALEMLDSPPLEVVPWDERHVALAIEAFFRFGKGRSGGQLNFGDCMAYAVAKALDAPLLFKGDDFARTDIAAAIQTGM